MSRSEAAVDLDEMSPVGATANSGEQAAPRNRGNTNTTGGRSGSAGGGRRTRTQSSNNLTSQQSGGGDGTTGSGPASPTNSNTQAAAGARSGSRGRSGRREREFVDASLNPPSGLKKFHERPSMTLTKPPELVLGILLANTWKADFIGGSCCELRSLFCTRCDVVQQRRLLRPAPGTAEMHQVHDQRIREEEAPDRWCSDGTIVVLVLVADLLTGGLPIGPFYQGLGTGTYGCWTRWLVRKHYRIDGFGWVDLLSMIFFPGCAVSQQREEMAINGIVPPSPLEME